LSLRGSETTEAISSVIGKYGIATPAKGNGRLAMTAEYE